MARLMIIFLVLLMGHVAVAQTPAPKSFTIAIHDKRDHYIADILALALDNSGVPYQLSTVGRIRINQERALEELDSPSPRYNIHYSGYSAARANDYDMVRYPVTLGLLGHRVLVSTVSKRGNLDALETAADLQRGAILLSGSDWPDTAILRQAGFRVMADTDSFLWPLLKSGRANLFPRGLNEVASELALHNPEETEPVFEVFPGFVLRYRFDLFFYLRKGDVERRAIVETGMERVIQNGELLELLLSKDNIRNGLCLFQDHEPIVIDIATGTEPTSEASSMNWPEFFGPASIVLPDDYCR